MDMRELHEKFSNIGMQYTTIQGVRVEDECGNAITGIINKIGKENKIVLQIANNDADCTEVKKMNLFDKQTENETYFDMSEVLTSAILLDAKEKVSMQLKWICSRLSTGIQLSNLNSNKSVRPYIDGNSCAIRVSVDSHKPLDIYIISCGVLCENSLLMTAEFADIGISNAKELIRLLNDSFDMMNFMLDVDTNEN